MLKLNSILLKFKSNLTSNYCFVIVTAEDDPQIPILVKEAMQETEHKRPNAKKNIQTTLDMTMQTKDHDSDAILSFR